MTDWKSFQAQLDQRQPLPPLRANEAWDPDLSRGVLEADASALTGHAHPSTETAMATKIGLLVWNDDLDAAHAFAQDLNHPLGSYWHAILHRREGDYDNAKYWFHRVGEHPIFAPIYAQATRLWKPTESWGQWSAHRFVDAVQSAVENDQGDSAEAESLKRIQVVEFSFLLRYPLVTNI